VISEQAAVVFRSHRLLQESASVRALAEVTRLKDDFLSVVAHDVRTPLTTILINAELLDQAMRGDGRNAKRASALRTEALRLKQLVEDYLDVVRAEHGREVRREPHDLGELTREALDGIGDAAGRVNLSVEGPVRGDFDASRIQQLVQNLVSNALKYSERSDPVEVRVWAEEGKANLSVTDVGIGIPEADLSRLFERFHRGSNTDDRRFGGMGLGLYICRLIAEEHDGSISVSSRPDVGTTFVVTLNAKAVAVPADSELETA
jgi:signal transduction histidine kinase